MKLIAAVLIVTLLLPTLSSAAPGQDLTRPDMVQTAPSQSPSDRAQALDYSPRAEKVYLGTGIGTLLAGGGLVAFGVSLSNSNTIGAEGTGTFLAATGGIFLAASTVLWSLYIRERIRAPQASVGLDLDKGRGVVVATIHF